ncbi:hypothetical protein BT96DRAFT_1015411 [Gymnopus androsaceus JB14]|uniref:Ser-Thr-rich glycosyl-phosphatidyl-inositol-anchored membrane family-domain-containing protein n=1 Tax=Gymnopus androsaceus JB14 TaxID=1447944 RepID=A0A6A4I556_9AGAR|nr:hypothetical protein BT96DRAFT_1015411 [Gymnopus androsaceus JB14]
MLTLMISCLFFSFQLARALPLLVRDVFDPTITSPTASTVWQSGQTVTVTWDTSNIPSQLSNPIGMVVLGFMANSTDSEHLMLDSPLAQNFNISDGSVSFVVPSVVTRTDYIIALFGDSGNISPTFTIDGISASSSTTETTTGSSSSSSGTSSSSTSTSSASSASSASTQVTTTVSVSSVAGSTTTTESATEASITSTFTSLVTATPSSSSSVSVSTTLSVSSPASSAAGSSSTSSTSSTSASTTVASSNSAWKTNTRQSQTFAFVIAGLLAACLS